MTSNWLSWFRRSPIEIEREETFALFRHVRHIEHASPFYPEGSVQSFVIDIIRDATEERWDLPGVPLGGALYATIKGLLYEEGFLIDLPEESALVSLTIDEGVRLRKTLRTHERFITAHARLLPMWRARITQIVQGLLEFLPESVFIDVDEDGNVYDNSVVFPAACAYDLCEKLPELLERLIVSFYEDDLMAAKVFDPIRELFEINLSHASGFKPSERYGKEQQTIVPTRSKITDPQALVDIYCQSTPFYHFFYSRLPFAIPFPARFEHTHIVGGTGHGKTQLMQFLIHHDIVRSKEDRRSIVVIDSQGDLINSISHLGYFAEPEYAERLVLMNPNDIEYPVCLNMFDFNRDRLSGYAPLDKEKILNATIELYEYFFGALLGAELTQRQGLIFKYLARLLIEIPDANIHTLRDLMENGEKYRPYMERLTGSTRSFFATQFFEPKFRETKKQILTRLWGVLSNSSLERMFSHPRSKIDIFQLLNEGKIILINTAKDLLGQDGAAIFGRFFISLIAQAAVQRSALPPHERRSAFVYIDEAQDYFDDNISHLLNQARKYRIGLIFAHQNLDQLGAGLRSSVLASTSIKFAGGVSAKDAATLDSELRCTTDVLLRQKKGKEHTEFACFVKNVTTTALSITIPLGFVEGREQIEPTVYAKLVEQNRELYTEPPLVPEDVPFPGQQAKVEKLTSSRDIRPKEPPREPPKDIAADAQSTAQTCRPSLAPKTSQAGKGGRQHKYLQHLVKQLGEEQGFRATIEQPILDGAGRVDISLVRDNLQIAFQVSVTTTMDWELGGVEKCFAAGFQEVVLIGISERHVKRLSEYIEANLSPEYQSKVRYLTSESIMEFLNSYTSPVPREKLVKGYKVRTRQQGIDQKEATLRRKAISEVIAKSIQKNKGI